MKKQNQLKEETFEELLEMALSVRDRRDDALIKLRAAEEAAAAVERDLRAAEEAAAAMERDFAAFEAAFKKAYGDRDHIQDWIDEDGWRKLERLRANLGVE